MKNLKILASAIALTTLTACTHSITGMESYKYYGERLEDTKIINNVRVAFSQNPLIPDKLIHLAIDRGIVQLSGFVHNNQEADVAILITKNTPGVKGIINSLVVMSSSEYSAKRAQAESTDARR
jgi:osmotically-inducible protein OsmY